MVRLPPLLVLLALFLPPQQAGDPTAPQAGGPRPRFPRRQQRYGAPPPPATQPAALPKLELGPANCVDMFGAGVSGGGTNGSGALFDEQEAPGVVVADGDDADSDGDDELDPGEDFDTQRDSMGGGSSGEAG